MTLLYTDERFQDHETGRHPECPARLRAIDERLQDSGLLEICTLPEWDLADRDDVDDVHDAQYISDLKTFVDQGGGSIDGDTVTCPASFDVAMLAAGAAIDAVERVITHDDSRALCLVRPPGHHALPARAMGFCLLANVSIAAEYARRRHGLERILIVDWDVHHGNGTQDVFYRDEQVTFLSSHRWPFWPGSGSEEETGEGPGLGTTFNLPLAYGTSRRDILDRFASLLESAAARCRPQLVLLSAGFDAHRRDPIGSLGLETEDFGTLTSLVADVADEYADGRLVSLLEGGYDLEALAESVELHLRTLVDE